MELVRTASATAPASQPQIQFETQGCSIASWRNVLLSAWSVQGSIQLAQELDRVAERFVTLHPEGHSSLHVITNGAALPDADARAQFQKTTDRHADRIACVGMVIDGTGFWSSATRGFLTSIHMMSRKPFELKYASDLRSIAEWVPPRHEARTGARIEAADLLQVLSNVRARLAR